MAYVWIPVLRAQNYEVRKFAEKSEAVIEKLLKEGLYVDTYEDVAKRHEQKNWVMGGLIHHPELGALVQEATSKEGGLNMLKERLIGRLRHHLPDILNATISKYDSEKNRQEIVNGALTAFEKGECPIINGLIIKKEEPAPIDIYLPHYQN
ncbi:MAG: hypothetical protein Q7J54_06735 [Candidatus Woesearchaeota archaeon]|nr:hypothetical protein [Candidatus Woesearchaeota archaeon]